MKRILAISLLLGLLLASCVEEPKIDFKDLEQRSLRAWMEKYHPELIDNYQEEGGYYVEVLDYGCVDSLPITGKDVWLWYDFTGRDLDGNVCETRNWELAYQLGTYSEYAHYVPTYRFSGAESHNLQEGSYLATFNELTIDGEPFNVRYGTKLRLYLPSSIIAGDSGVEGDGGYEGQYALDGNKPMIMDMTVYGHVANPVAYEGECVDAFANANGGICTTHIAEKPEATSYARRRGATRADKEVDTRPLEFFDGRWHQPIDTLKQLYVNYSYSPANVLFDYNTLGVDTLKYPGENVYTEGQLYGSMTMSDLDRRINEALVERFGAGITYDEVLDADSLNTKATANIWYIGRFIDGFIFDTNIDEVKEIIYGSVEQEGKALSFETSRPLDNDYILAWNYAMPTLRRGQWATILTVSTYAYGISGKVGSHTTTTTNNNSYDYMNYYNYMNYMNNYYGYGYGGMYNSGYYGGGYNPYYYGYNYIPPTSGSTTTVTTTSAEIPAYAPLIFQVFVAK